MYVCAPSRTDPSVAPPGDENLFVLVPVPADVSIGAGGIDGAGDPLVERVADAPGRLGDVAREPLRAALRGRGRLAGGRLDGLRRGGADRVGARGFAGGHDRESSGATGSRDLCSPP